MSVVRLFLSSPKVPESNCKSNSQVWNDPYEAVALISMSGRISLDKRLTDPPKLVGPMVDAIPGLRSKSTPPIHCPGKKTQEWCVGEFVSSKGIRSQVIVYEPS